MAVKKSKLYASLWRGCDELRGGMDASQYKDYVLVLLFVKYVSDKHAGVAYAPIEIPEGASFDDLVAMKGHKEIGDRINKEVLAPLQQANPGLSAMPDFNDDEKLGSGKEKVDRLTNLIAIFESPDLDFSDNRADGDDLLGDAYEYLMRHFATESGKSKGQFYTPGEVSRLMADVLGVARAAEAGELSASTTAYDPTCGSGSLLLRVAETARAASGTALSLYGQEKDAATAGLARMNMILHDFPGAEVVRGNTLTEPAFAEGERLKSFDFVVANPPFSDKKWRNGFGPPEDDRFGRFAGYGAPPPKQGDYAYLLHIVKSLKPATPTQRGGRGCCILPHGVLFRGNAEAAIRERLLHKGLLAGVIGLPANLFYGTGIPACVLVLDAQGAAERESVFLVDASGGYAKDGPKNRLRARDLHRVVDAWEKQEDVPGFARRVPLDEIEANGFNLNLPRYLDAGEAEDLQDLDAHLNGGIPEADVDALSRFWSACPGLREDLFAADRPGYLRFAVEPEAIRATVRGHGGYLAYREEVAAHFAAWREGAAATLRGFAPGKDDPKAVVRRLSEGLLAHAADAPGGLVDPYAVYQHLMTLAETELLDDLFLIAAGGWVADVDLASGQGKKKGSWSCELIPKELVAQRFLLDHLANVYAEREALERAAAARAELEEEQSAEGGAFAELEKVNKGNVTAARKEADDPDERAALDAWLAHAKAEAAAKKTILATEAALDAATREALEGLTPDDVKALVVEDKWLALLGAAIDGEVTRALSGLTERLAELAERYGSSLRELGAAADAAERRVEGHLAAMGVQAA